MAHAFCALTRSSLPTQMSSSCAANSEHVSRVVVVGEGPELVFCLHLYRLSLSLSQKSKKSGKKVESLS